MRSRKAAFLLFASLCALAELRAEATPSYLGKVGNINTVMTRKNTKIISFEQALELIPKANNEGRATLHNLQITNEAKRKSNGEVLYLKNYRRYEPSGNKPDSRGIRATSMLGIPLVIELGKDRFSDADIVLIPIEKLTLP